MINPAYLPFILAGGVIIFLVIFFHYVPFFLWLSAKVSGVKISLIQLFLMRIRNVPPYVIVPAMIEAHKAGLSTITRDELDEHRLKRQIKAKVFQRQMMYSLYDLVLLAERLVRHKIRYRLSKAPRFDATGQRL